MRGDITGHHRTSSDIIGYERVVACRMARRGVRRRGWSSRAVSPVARSRAVSPVARSRAVSPVARSRVVMSRPVSATSCLCRVHGRASHRSVVCHVSAPQRREPTPRRTRHDKTPRPWKRINVRKPPGRRRLQRHVGPGHGRRRAFGMPDREHGRDTGVADTDRAVMTRDPATGPPAHDPATGPPARDAHPHRRIRRRTIRHATPIRDAVSGDGRYGTRRSFPMPCPTTGDTARDSSRVRRCPDMPGYARNVFGIYPVMPDDAR